MIQIFHPYHLWEDFQNGMYDVDKKQNEKQLIDNSVSLLRDLNEFLKVMKSVVSNWKISTDVNLSNHNSNRQSWLGQASCCYKLGCPELLTRKAWAMLSDIERYMANETANIIIRQYEIKNIRIHKNMGTKGLF